jgi:drug/metabolite transporter (DMT)-like permease
LNARPHEITLLKIKNLIRRKIWRGRNPHDAMTGTGPILSTTSFPYVCDWLNKHPFRNKRDARLICNVINRSSIGVDAIDKVMKQLTLWITIITLSIAVGSSFISIKIVLDFLPPLFAFSFRFIISGAILILVSYIFDRKNEEIRKIKLWTNSLFIGIFMIYAGHGLIAWGAQFLTAGTASLLNSTIPLWVALLMFLLFHYRIINLTKIGLLLGFGGMIILVGPSIGGNGSDLVGIASLLLSSLSMAIASVYYSRVSLPQSVLLSAGMLMLIGGALQLISSAILGELNLLPSYSDITLSFLLSYLLLIFVGTVIPLAELFWLLKVSSPSIATTFAYVAPIVAVLLGWVILGESVTYLTVLATIVILIGVALIVRTSEKKQVLS